MSNKKWLTLMGCYMTGAGITGVGITLGEVMPGGVAWWWVVVLLIMALDLWTLGALALLQARKEVSE